MTQKRMPIYGYNGQFLCLSHNLAKYQYFWIKKYSIYKWLFEAQQTSKNAFFCDYHSLLIIADLCGSISEYLYKWLFEAQKSKIAILFDYLDSHFLLNQFY